MLTLPPPPDPPSPHTRGGLAASCFAGLSSIWRHSAKIKRDGFLTESFAVQGISTNMVVRQVDFLCVVDGTRVC